MKKTIIFDLDGTLALIDERRRVSDDGNGKIDWDKFFDPKNIDPKILIPKNDHIISIPKMVPKVRSKKVDPKVIPKFRSQKY